MTVADSARNLVAVVVAAVLLVAAVSSPAGADEITQTANIKGFWRQR